MLLHLCSRRRCFSTSVILGSENASHLLFAHLRPLPLLIAPFEGSGMIGAHVSLCLSHESHAYVLSSQPIPAAAAAMQGGQSRATWPLPVSVQRVGGMQNLCCSSVGGEPGDDNFCIKPEDGMGFWQPMGVCSAVGWEGKQGTEQPE